MLLLALALHLGAADQTPRALELLEASGQTYEKFSTGWMVKFNGKNQKEIRVNVVQTETVVVLVTIVAIGTDIKDRAGLHEALLHANDDYDRVKTVMDDDNDYLLRADVITTGMDGKAFNDQLVQIATVTDLLKPIVDKFRK
jgi:hypothetical protein